MDGEHRSTVVGVALPVVGGIAVDVVVGGALGGVVGGAVDSKGGESNRYVPNTEHLQTHVSVVGTSRVPAEASPAC